MKGYSKFLFIILLIFIIKVESQWEPWSEWSSCSLTCGDGNQTRTRVCDNATLVNCTGDDEEVQGCSLRTCPYVQLCPMNYFSCHSGSVKCISRDVMCDCTSDCSDGSDETMSYAGCTSQAVAACSGSGSGGGESVTRTEKDCPECHQEIVACSLMIPFVLFTFYQLWKVYKVLI